MSWTKNDSRRTLQDADHNGTVGLYRFFNAQAGRYGDPFRMCESCAKLQTIPQACTLEKMADNATGECQGESVRERTARWETR